MASILVIPILLSAAAALAGYLLYRYVLYDMRCRRAVEGTLRRHEIKKTPLQIIQEYHRVRGTDVSEREASRMERHYRQNEPDQFLAMYDAVREAERDGRG